MGHEVWSVELNEQPAGRLLVFDKLLMVSTQRTERSLHQVKLWAYELADGNLNWSRSFEQVQVSGLVKTPSEAAPLVVALDSTDWLSGRGMLLALDIHGEVQWRYSTSAQRLSTPAVDRDVICVTAGTRMLSVVSVETGVERGKIELDVSASFAAPAVANDVAYVPCRGPYLLAVGFDGRTHWRFDAEGTPDQVWLHMTPSLVEDRVIATTSAGSVIALKVQDGSLIWQTNVGPVGKRLGPSATDGELVYVGASDGLYALDSKDGRGVWTFSTARRIEAAPILVGGVVYVTCHDHHIYALDALSGKELWRREVGKRRIELPPVLTSPHYLCGPCVLVADRGGKLTVIVRSLSAEEHEITGHWEEAVSVYVDLGLFSRAAQLLESHNEPLRAAELWEMASEKERAALQYEGAQAWQRAAQLWELLNCPLRQAQALKQYAMWLDENEADISFQVTAWRVAAQAFETEGKVDELAVCQKEIARILQQPLITADVEHESLVLNRWTRINFVVRNEGYGTAHQLIIRATGDQFEGQAATTREIVALKAGRERAEWLDIRPCQHGDSVPLRLSVEYRDDKGNIQTNSQTVHLPVAGADVRRSESQSWQIHTGGGAFILGSVETCGEKLVVCDQQVGVIGDHTQIEGGIHFHSDDNSPDLAQLRLDAAAPDQVCLQRPFEVAVAVRQKSSPVFREQDLTLVKSGRLQISWPEDKYCVRLTIQVEAPECKVVGKSTCSFLLHWNQNSPTCFFTLIPKRLGEISVVIKVLQEDDWLGSTRVRTTVKTQIVGSVVLRIVSNLLAKYIQEPRRRKRSNMDYERGLDALRQLAEGTDWYQDFTAQEAPLRENLSDERRYGPSEQTRRDRTRIVDRLNALALKHLGISFNDLCLGKQPPSQTSTEPKGNGDPADPEQLYGTGNPWAVLVGVNEYEDSANYGELQVCVKDVEAVHEQLVTGGFDPARIRLLTDHTDEPPTRANILTALKAVADATEPDDLLLFYYSGHGEEDGGESYLVAQDGRRLVLGDTAVSLSRVKEIVEEAPARAKVIVLDACHSGADIGGKGPEPMSEAFIRRVFEEAEGMAILASCKQGQLSYEWREPGPGKGRSVFTHFLLEALAGAADRDEKGFVTVQDASRHVTNGVKLWASQRNTSQIPTLQYTVAGDIILVRYQ